MEPSPKQNLSAVAQWKVFHLCAFHFELFMTQLMGCFPQLRGHACSAGILCTHNCSSSHLCESFGVGLLSRFRFLVKENSLGSMKPTSIAAQRVCGGGRVHKSGVVE